MPGVTFACRRIDRRLEKGARPQPDGLVPSGLPQDIASGSDSAGEVGLDAGEGEDLDGPVEQQVAGGLAAIGHQLSADRFGILLGDDRPDDGRCWGRPLLDELPEEVPGKSERLGVRWNSKSRPRPSGGNAESAASGAAADRPDEMLHTSRRSELVDCRVKGSLHEM